MHNLVKAGLLSCATSIGLCSTLGAGPSQAESVPSQPSGPVSQQLIAQAPIVDQAVAYKQGTGFYATLGLGAQWPQRTDGSTTIFDPALAPVPINLGGSVGAGGGFSGDVGIGYDFGAIRAELTYGYSNASANDVRLESVNGGNVSQVLGGFPSLDISGSINKNDILASAYWDIDTNSRWSPYIGGGIGWTNIGSPAISILGTNLGSGNSNGFGYQAKLGVTYGASENTDVYVEGVYQGASGLSNVNELDFSSFNSWGAKIGVRFRFGGVQTAAVQVVQPQPMPAPAPMQPEPAPTPIRGLW